MALHDCCSRNVFYVFHPLGNLGFRFFSPEVFIKVHHIVCLNCNNQVERVSTGQDYAFREMFQTATMISHEDASHTLHTVLQLAPHDHRILLYGQLVIGALQCHGQGSMQATGLVGTVSCNHHFVRMTYEGIALDRHAMTLATSMYHSFIKHNFATKASFLDSRPKVDNEVSHRLVATKLVFSSIGALSAIVSLVSL